MTDDAINENSDSAASCEGEEMAFYRKCARNVVTFRIVRKEDDVDSPQKKTNSFKPDMTHQIFGEQEMIFGYKHISINLYYLHNSAKCFVDFQATDKIQETKLQSDDVMKLQPDDVMELLNPWLPMNYRLDKDDFKRDISEENHTVLHGKVINTFKDDKDRTFKITICDTKSEDFKIFHQRFETFIIWFIDGANFIDLEDSRWEIFYVYEEYVDPETSKTCYSPVGFCTVYKFYLYPSSVRPRISQFFVLPTYQKRGIGTNMYSVVYNYLKELPDAGDITVEEPTPLFQRIRDFCDSARIYQHLQVNNVIISTQNRKKIKEFVKEQKICKKQTQRVFDILDCLTAHKKGYKEYMKFTQSIKKRIATEVEKETRGSKRLCNSERVGISVVPTDKKAAIDAEYNKYLDSLEWPVNRLRTHLAKASTR